MRSGLTASRRVALVTVTVVATGCVGTAAAAPRLTGAGFVAPATIGRLAQLELSASDPAATIGDVSVAFGRHEGVFALGACRPPDSSGRQPGGAFAPGATTRFRVPHVFGAGGARPVLVRLESGGCSETSSTAVEQLTVTPTPPAQPPAPLPPPTLLATTGVPGLPTGPLQTPPVPGVPTLPSLPTVPTLPTPPIGLPRVSAAASCAGANRAPGRSAASLAAARKAVVCLLNAARRSAGERPLRESRTLDRAATQHDIDMVRGGFFSHADPSGGLIQRLQRLRYITPRVRWTVGENIGAGAGPAGTPATMVRAWLASPEHRANILFAGFHQIGVGISKGEPGAPGRGVTYTTDFGARS